jgi:hypothetical protein
LHISADSPDNASLFGKCLAPREHTLENYNLCREKLGLDPVSTLPPQEAADIERSTALLRIVWAYTPEQGGARRMCWSSKWETWELLRDEALREDEERRRAEAAAERKTAEQEPEPEPESERELIRV